MKKEINVNIQIRDFGLHKQLKINIDNTICTELCMMLFLLKEGLAKTLELNFKNFTFFFKIQSGNHSLFTHLNIIKGVFSGSLALNALEYMLHFLLKYYRDQVGGSEHIDIEFNNEAGEDCTLTLMCENFIEYSEEDIKKMLK